MTSRPIDGPLASTAHPRADADRRSLTASLIWLAPFAITLLGFVLRVLWLDRQGLWVDESLTLDRAGWTLPTLWAGLPVEHVPLYFMLVSLFTRLAGDSDFALRFPSVAFGVAAIPLLYQLSRRLLGMRVALVAALLLAVNPLQVWYSQDARMYPQMVALSLAALLALDIALDRDSPPRQRGIAWVGYVIASAATFYTQYYGALTLMIATAYGALLLLSQRPWSARRWLPFIVAQAVIGALLLPYVPRILTFLGFVSHHEADPIGAAEFARLFSFGTTVPPEQATWLSYAALALYALGALGLILMLRHRVNQRGALFIASLVATFAVLVLVLNARESYYHIRYFVVIGALLTPLAALGVVTLARWSPILGALALTLAVVGSLYSLNLWYTNVDYAKSRHKDYVEYALAHAGPDDALITLGANDVLARRYGAERLGAYVPLDGDTQTRKAEQDTEQMLATITAGHPTVWYAHKAEVRDRYVKRWFDHHAFQTSITQMADFRLMEYGFPPPLPAATPATSVEGPLPIDVAWAAAPNPPTVGGTVYLALHWRPTAPLPANLKVSLRLYDADGKQVWQRDRAPNDGATPTQDWQPRETVIDRYGIHLPPELPPGPYSVRAILYDYTSLQPQREATLGVLTIAP